MAASGIERSRALWRRQVVLTLLAVLAFGGVSGLTSVVLSDWGRSPANEAELLALAVLIGVLLLVLLGAVVLHVVRTAQLAFRREGTD